MKFMIMTVLTWVMGILHASEQIDRLKLKNTAQHLYQQQSYAELIELMDAALINQERTNSGIWKLGLYFQGIAELADTQTTDETFWVTNKQSVLELITQYPSSPLGYLIQAEFLLQHAIMDRSHGVYEVDTVTKKRFWPQHDRLLEEVQNLLLTHKSIASKNPHWFVLMLKIASKQNWDISQFESIFNEAKSKFPQYYPILYEGLWYWYKRDGRLSDSIEQYINQVVQLTHQTEGKGMYARLHWYIMPRCDCDRVPMHEQSVLNWKKMKVAIYDVLRQYPDQWNINHFAYYACLSGDPVTTNQLIELVESPPLVEVWLNDGFYQSCVDWAKNSRAFKSKW